MESGIGSVARAASLVVVTGCAAGHAWADGAPAEGDGPGRAVIERLLEAASQRSSEDGDPMVERLVLSPDELEHGGVSILGDSECSAGLVVNTDPEGDAPAATAFSPDGSLIYVAHRCTSNITVYDAETREFVEEIALSDGPVDLAITPDGSTAVTANIFNNTASIVDLATGTEVANLPVGEGAATVRITPDGTTALVGSLTGQDVAVLDIASRTELRRIPNIGFFQTLAVNFEAFAVSVFVTNPLEIVSNTTAIFPDRGDDQIQFIDFTTGVVNSVPSNASPSGLAITPDGATAVVSHASFDAPDQVISVIDVASETITRTIPIGERPSGPISISPDGTKAAVAVQNATRVVDLTDDSVSARLESTRSLNQLKTTADGRFALGVGFTGSLISYATESVVANTNFAVSTAFGAISPVGTRAAMFSTTFGNDMVVVNTDGANGGLEAFRNSGPLPEGDKPRTIGVTPDGGRVVVANTFSDNVAVFDTSPQELIDYAAIGERAGQVRITPDGSTAVVANRDSDFVSLVDLDTLTTTNVPIGTRGDQVEISPDGRFAYIAVVSGGDGVWRVNLETQSVDGPKLFVGQMGGLGTGRFSGMALSHDGSTLVTCDSFDDQITIIDAENWSVVTTVPVGDFPLRAAFSPDDSTIYVNNRFGATVSFVANDGIDSTETAVVPTSDDNRTELITSRDGSKLYVVGLDEFVDVIDVASELFADQILLQDSASGRLFFDAQGRLLIANGTATASTSGGLTFGQDGRISAIDTSTDTIDEDLFTGDLWGRELAVSADGAVAATANLSAESVSIVGIEIPCPADLTGPGGDGEPDGTLTADDFFFYLGLFSDGDLAADLTGPGGDGEPDGSLTADDFFFYLGLFAAGCP